MGHITQLPRQEVGAATVHVMMSAQLRRMAQGFRDKSLLYPPSPFFKHALHEPAQCRVM